MVDTMVDRMVEGPDCSFQEDRRLNPVNNPNTAYSRAVLV